MSCTDIDNKLLVARIMNESLERLDARVKTVQDPEVLARIAKYMNEIMIAPRPAVPKSLRCPRPDALRE